MFLPAHALIGAAPAPLGKATADYLRATSRSSIGFVSAVDRFIRRGKAVGWYPALHFCFLYGVPGQADVLVNLGTMTTAGGVRAGDLKFLPYGGLTGAPASLAWVDHKLRWADVPGAAPDAHWCGCYVTSELGGGDVAFGFSGGGTIGPRPKAGQNLQWFCNAPTPVSLRVTSGVGSTAYFRGSLDAATIAKSGTETAVQTPGNASLPVSTLAAFRAGATGSTYSAVSLSAVFGGGGRAMLEHPEWRDDFYDALDELMLAIGTITLDQLIWTPESIATPHTFGPSSNALVTPPGLRILRNTTPPQEGWGPTGDKAFASAPMTDIASTQTAPLVATDWTGGGLMWWAWGNRPAVRTTLSDNPINPAIRRSDNAECRMRFTPGTGRADAATLAHIAYQCGHDAHQGDGMGYLDFLNHAGMPDSAWTGYAYAAAHADELFTTQGFGATKVSIDKVIAPDAPFQTSPRRTGIVLDYEAAVQSEGLTTTLTLLIVAQMIQAAGMEAILYLNALNSGNAGGQGFDRSNLYMLHDAYDFMTILVYAGSPERDAAQSIRNQLALLTGPDGTRPIDYSKIALTVGFGGYKVELIESDALACRQALTGALTGCPTGVTSDKKIGMLIEWRNFGRPGGAPGGPIGLAPRTINGVRRAFNQIWSILTGLPLGQYFP